MYFNAKVFGSRLKKLRQLKGLTQEQMADALQITPSYLAKLESGTRTPSIDNFIQFRLCFGVTFEYLILGEDLSEIPDGELELRAAEVLEALAARKLNT